MGGRAAGVRSLEQVRAAVVERLRARQAELEGAIFERVRADVPDPVGDGDAELAAGLRAVIRAVVEAALASIESGEPWSGPVPHAAVLQAQRAARSGVTLDAAHQRYLAGHELLLDRVLEEIARGDCSLREQTVLCRQAHQAQMSLLRRLAATIADEYDKEARRAVRSSEQRRAEIVTALLDGRVVDTTPLGYELGVAHVGMIATGAGARDAVRCLAVPADRRLLCVARGERTVWAWLGAREAPATSELERCWRACTPAGVSLALGEPADGTAGFRASHRQAQAALQVAQHRGAPVTRYIDVVVLATTLQNELARQALAERYLRPLGRGKRGEVLRDTLRAYFATEHNAQSAAAMLGIHRETVTQRLKTIEERLGCAVGERRMELETALRLEELH
jgi:hypothetical protein